MREILISKLGEWQEVTQQQKMAISHNEERIPKNKRKTKNRIMSGAKGSEQFFQVSL